ncbi:MAG: hypothetical protein ABW169_10405 [Sphingobium sp.]
MRGRNLLWRLAGLCLVLASYGSSLILREVQRGSGPQSALPLEMALSLLSFLAASIGLLLLINGFRLRDRWQDDIDHKARERLRQSRTRGHATPPAPEEGRAPLADLLAWHAVNQQHLDPHQDSSHRRP